MSKSAFAQKIISKLKSAIGTDGQSFGNSTASSAMQAVADGITEYLIANTKVDIAYAGVIPGSPPTPDPTVSDTFKIVGKCAPPSATDDFSAWLKKIESNIIAGFSLASAGTAGVVFAQKPFAVTGITTTQSDLKAKHAVGDESPQQKIWEIVCGGIMDWINGTAMNAASGAASHPSATSTGTANIVKITLT
jgi:hypothetical protein